MTKVLADAFKKISKLADATQDRIGYQLIDQYTALQELQAELDIGLRELDQGMAASLDIQEVIASGRKRHGKKG